MDALRPSQLDLLARHRLHSLAVLLAPSASYAAGARLQDTDEGRALLAQPRDILASAAIAAAAATADRHSLAQRVEVARRAQSRDPTEAFSAELLTTLRRRRLPFDPEDVELLLELGRTSVSRDPPLPATFAAASFAISAAGHLLATQPAGAPLRRSLERLRDALDAPELAPSAPAAALSRRTTALLAGTVPGGLLDLSIVDRRDAWAAEAEAALRRHADRWEDVQSLVALVARARGTRPTQAWLRDAESLRRRYGSLGDLLRELLEPILRIDLSTSGRDWPPGWLLAPGNETLVRGAIWATRTIDEAWVVPLLGRLALRGAAPAPQAGVTLALSHTVAGAAIDTLGAIGTRQARVELRVLLGEIRRRDLLRRIAVLVGEELPATLARDELIRREKRRTVRSKGPTDARERQQLATGVVRRDLAPALRAAGFASRGRTFWRDRDDRVEVLHCRASREGLSLELGIWFRFVPRPVARGEAVPRPAPADCDLRCTMPTSHDELRETGAAARAWFDRWRSLPSILRWLLVGATSSKLFGPGGRESPGHALLTGYVAREVGEGVVARKRLARAAALYRASPGDPPSRADADREAWLEQIEADAGS